MGYLVLAKGVIRSSSWRSLFIVVKEVYGVVARDVKERLQYITEYRPVSTKNLPLIIGAEIPRIRSFLQENTIVDGTSNARDLSRVYGS